MVWSDTIIATQIPGQIHENWWTWRNDITMDPRGQRDFGQILAANMAFSSTLISRIFYDTNICEWVCIIMILRLMVYFWPRMGLIYAMFSSRCRLLKRGSMFILSEMQFARLLAMGGFVSDSYSRRNSISVLGMYICIYKSYRFYNQQWLIARLTPFCRYWCRWWWGNTWTNESHQPHESRHADTCIRYRRLLDDERPFDGEKFSVIHSIKHFSAETK